MMLAPGDDLIKIVTGGDGGAGHQQQNFRQRIHDPPGLTRIVKAGKMPQKHGKPGPRRVDISIKVYGVHGRKLPSNQMGPANHTRAVNQIPALTRLPSRA